MKAIRAYAYGGPERLTLEDIPDPVPGEGEVLIDVAASGVNPVDWKILEGRMKAFLPLSLPYTPGVEVSGRISALGAELRASPWATKSSVSSGSSAATRPE